MWPGETTKAWQGMPPGRPIRPRIDDVELHPRADAGAQERARRARRRGARRCTYGRKTVNGRVIGAHRSLRRQPRKHYPRRAAAASSTPPTRSSAAASIFLGDEMATDIFGEEDPVGKTLLINNSPYTVIGVMQKKMQMGTYGGPDANHAVIPITTFKAQFGRERLNVLVIETHEPERDGRRAEARQRDPRREVRLRPDRRPRVRHVGHGQDARRSTRKIIVGIQIFLGIVGALTLHHRRRRRGEHHVRRGQGAHPRDRREDGPRREGALDHRAVRARRPGLHLHRRRARASSSRRCSSPLRRSCRSRATT